MSITLDKFKYDNVLQGALELFDSLGIKWVTPSNRPISLNSVIVDQSVAVKDVIEKVDDAYFIGAINDKTLQGEDESLSFDEGHYKGMMAFAIDVKDDANITRTDIATLTRALNRMSKAAPVALIVRYGDKISFSICERTAYKQEGHSGEKAGRVSILRDIDIENTHRGHIDILEMMHTGGITSYDELYAKWLEVFSSDTLTKRFYQELSNWYALAIQIIRFPNDLSTTDDDQKYNNEGVIRLITRLIFVWFLKQRKLIPAEFFDPNFVGEKLLKEFDPHKPEGLFSESARNSHYYRGILQNLFFATLNCPLTKEGKNELTERCFKVPGRSQYNVNNLMRYRDLFRDPELFIQMCNTVPFLNGGLFDCLDEKGKDGMYYDGFSECQDSIAQLVVPDYLFFSDNIKADLSGFYDDSKQKNVTVRGLIDIFNRYQFTVEENTPLDQEVALDPELLGKVFENLLASFNPETKTTARKQTGSFYTPREIVQYMVDESLVAHLKKVVDPDLENEYRKLLSYTDEPVNLTEEQKKAIMHGLYNCKILDPACGSGAFPMGILQQMVHILTKIDPDNTQWKEMLLDIAISETSDAYRTSSDAERQEAILDIEKSFNAKINRPDYARKLYLIENCIYGVDIQPIAIQISKLRFFISLVIDQITNNDPADNYGIRPLPNLEAKFVAANSLRSISRATTLGDTDDIKSLKNDLKRLNHEIFGVKSWYRKKKVQTLLSEKRQELAEELASIGMFSESESNALASWDMFDQNHHADFFDPEWMFGIKDGFDIVIGNPPYVVVKKDYCSHIGKYDTIKCYELYAYFFERGVKLLKDGGVLSYITSSSYLKIGKFKDLRNFLTSNTNLIKFRNEGDDVFKAACVPTCTIIIERKISSNWSFEEITGMNDPIINKIEDCGIPLSELAIVQRGFEIGRDKLSKDVDSHKFITGSNVTHYTYTSLSYISNKIVKEYSKDRKFYTGERVLIRETGARLMAIYLNEELYCNRSLFTFLIKNSELSAKFLTGYLNSKIAHFYYDKKFKAESELFPKIRIRETKIMPIPIPPRNIQEGISNIVDEIIINIHNRDTVSRLSTLIDLILYKFLHFTYEEIIVVEPDTSLTREEYDNFKVF